MEKESRKELIVNDFYSIVKRLLNCFHGIVLLLAKRKMILCGAYTNVFIIIRVHIGIQPYSGFFNTMKI